MAEEIMYPGIANSPQTELSSAIDDVATTIPLVDASVLPDGPNIAVIGTAEDAETVIYTDKSDNDLTGVTRGVEGTAKAWGAGVKVARNFTNLDYESLRLNVANMFSIFDTSVSNVVKLDRGIFPDITALDLTEGSPATDYPDGMSMLKAFSSDWDGKSGVVLTYKDFSYCVQHLTLSYPTVKNYTRYYDSSPGVLAWGPWVVAESEDGAQAKVDDLAGSGRTTETVKGNADAIAAHLAEKATDTILGHIIGGIGTSIDGTGKLTAGEYKIGSFTRDVSLASGTQAITGVGFKPRIVVFFAAIKDVAGRASWGFGSSAANVSIVDSNGNTAGSYSVNVNKSIAMNVSPGNATEGVIQSLDTDGFTISWAKSGTVTGTATIGYLAIK